MDNALDNFFRRAVPGGDGLDHAAVTITHSIQRRDINPLDLRGGAEKCLLVPLLRLCFAVQLDDRRDQLLPLADEGHVDKIRHRLRVIHGCAACDYQRGQGRTLLAAQGQAA